MQRAAKVVEDEVKNEIEPLIKAMGLVPVEISVKLTKQYAAVGVVIYRSGGVTVEHCSQVSRTIQPRLELLPDLGNFQLEVSSPGMSRELKGRRDYDIFLGRGAAVLLEGSSEWLRGIMERTDGENLFLRVGEDLNIIPFGNIRRAKLTMIEGENKNVL